MLSTARAKSLLVAAAAAISLAAAGDARAAGQATWYEDGIERVTAITAEGGRQFVRWVEAGYARRPAVMIGLAGVLLLPPLMLVGALLYRRSAKPARAAPLDDGGHAPADALIEIEGASSVVLPAGRALVQIGRQDDNDICIADESVQRYHAVIVRTGDDGFTITDVSGLEGAGLRVNGEPRASAVLANGDTVELGRTRMRFATAA